MKQHKLSDHYTGDTAAKYEDNRKQGKKWQAEQVAMEKLFSELPENMSIIDIPVGTGRFFELYMKKGCSLEGVDISEDMLNEARKSPFAKDIKHKLCIGDIFKLDYPDNSFDTSVCIRFMNLVNSEAVKNALLELSRVSSRYVITGIRHTPPYKDLKIHTIGGAQIYVRQVLSRLKQVLQKKIFFHKEQDIMRFFENAGLKVKAKECIEYRNHGTDYYIYLLEKK